VEGNFVSSSKQKILMCAPDHFGVDYVINPWMEHNRGKTDAALVAQQWNGLRDAIAKLTDVVLIPPQPGLPDMVFTANAGMVLGDIAVASRFRSNERRGEEAFFRPWFQQNGFKLAPWPNNVFFEGAGDCLLDRGQKIIWTGFGIRSDEGSLTFLGKLFPEWRVEGLRLIDPRFYHLDTCFCPLEGGYALYFPAAFYPESRQKIESAIPKDKLIAVEEADALTFSCNAVDLDHHVIVSAASLGLQKRLADVGFKAVITPLTEFLKAGGTAKCLTLKLVE
jgi:N-dimethylarginine dimethylaminohydrolase